MTEVLGKAQNSTDSGIDIRPIPVVFTQEESQLHSHLGWTDAGYGNRPSRALLIPEALSAAALLRGASEKCVCAQNPSMSVMGMLQQLRQAPSEGFSRHLVRWCRLTRPRSTVWPGFSQTADTARGSTPRDRHLRKHRQTDPRRQVRD
jgi:hypothetical protein